jgi:aspartate aminotransferase
VTLATTKNHTTIDLLVNGITMRISFNFGLFLIGGVHAEAFSVEAAASKAARLSVWNDVPMGPPDAILGIAQAFRDCEDERKVNVCVGAYRDASGKPWVLPSVRSAEEKMLGDNNENKEYLPIDGDQAFVSKALKFAYGAEAPLERIAGVQTLSGTGAVSDM